MEKFDYFREKTGKNLNYNHYSGKLTPGCERSVIKIDQLIILIDFSYSRRL